MSPLTRADLLLLRTILAGERQGAVKRASIALKRGDAASAERHRLFAREVARVDAKLEAIECSL